MAGIEAVNAYKRKYSAHLTVPDQLAILLMRTAQYIQRALCPRGCRCNVVLILEGGNEGSRTENSVLKVGVSYSPQLGPFESLDGLRCFACLLRRTCDQFTVGHEGPRRGGQYDKHLCRNHGFFEHWFWLSIPSIRPKIIH